MQPLLFTYQTPEQAQWYDSDVGLQAGTLAELANHLRQHRTSAVLVIPAELVTLATIQVPGRNRTTRWQALPYALEDQLIDPVEELHFAAADASLRNSTAVAVIRHALLGSWLDDCQWAGFRPGAIIPDVLLLPWQPQCWSVLRDGDRVLLRTGIGSGFASDVHNFPFLLQLAITQAGDAAAKQLLCWGELPALELSGDSGSIIIQQQPSVQPLALFNEGWQVRQGINIQSINLLQGSYRTTEAGANWLRPWRVAAALLSAYIVMQGISQISLYWQLQQEQTRLSAAMEQVYRQAVPDARRIVNPRAQLDNHLAQLRGDSAGDSAAFLELLLRGGKTLVAGDGIIIRALRFKDSQLDIDLEGGSPQLLDNLRQRLSAETDLQSQLRSSKQEGKVESRITLKKVNS